MAKKKEPVKVEEQEDIIPAEQAIQEEIQEANDKKVEDFLGEPVKDGKVVEEKEPEVEEEPEEPKEEPKEPKEEVDLSKLKEEIKGEVKQETTDKILEALTGEKEKKDEKENELISPWAKEGRNPKDYEEVSDWGAEKVKILQRREAEAERVKTEKETKLQKELEADRQKLFDKHIDEQLNDLIENKRLPKPINKDDPKDEGVVARKALFQTMLDVNKKRAENNKAPIYSLKEIFYEHYKAPKKEVAGADAPVFSGSGKFTPQGAEEEINYKDIHGARSMTDLLK